MTAQSFEEPSNGNPNLEGEDVQRLPMASQEEAEQSESERSSSGDDSKPLVPGGMFGGKGYVVAAGFLNHIGTFGPMMTFGLFVPPFKQAFGVSLDAAASVISIMIGLQFWGGLFAGILIPRVLTHRQVCIISSLTAIGFFVLATFCQDVMQMRLVMALVGLSLGMNNLAALTSIQAIVPKEKRAISVGVATCGTPVATIILPTITSWLVEQFGWRVAMRVIGLACSLLLLAVSPAFRVDPSMTASTGAQPKRTCTETMKRRMPCLFEFAYAAYCLNMLICFTGYGTPYALLAEMGKEEFGMAPQTVALAYTIMGITGMPARLGQAWAVKKVGPRVAFWVAQCCTGILCVIFPFCRSVPSLYTCAAFSGLANGPVMALVTLLLSEVFGLERLPLLTGISRMCSGTGSLVGPVISAAIVTSVGYEAAFAFAGLCMLAPASLLLLMPRLQRLQDRRASTAARANASTSGEKEAIGFPKGSMPSDDSEGSSARA